MNLFRDLMSTLDGNQVVMTTPLIEDLMVDFRDAGMLDLVEEAASSWSIVQRVFDKWRAEATL